MARVKTNCFELSKARIMAGLTVAELAEKVGCSRQNLYMIEAGKTRPTPKLMQKIVAILNIPFDQIFSIVEGE